MIALPTSVFLARTPLFTTRAFAFACGKRTDSASRALSALASDGAVVRVTRGLWAQPAHPDFTPLGATPYLLGLEQGYVSFLTALHLHGVLSQIPNTIQVATTGHARTLKSAIGAFQFIQLKPDMMADGVSQHAGPCPFPIARPEKALLDTLYVATRRGRRFARLPELELDALQPRIFQALMREQVTAPGALGAMCTRLNRLAPSLLPKGMRAGKA